MLRSTFAAQAVADAAECAILTASQHDATAPDALLPVAKLKAYVYVLRKGLNHMHRGSLHPNEVKSRVEFLLVDNNTLLLQAL